MSPSRQGLKSWARFVIADDVLPHIAQIIRRLAAWTSTDRRAEGHSAGRICGSWHVSSGTPDPTCNERTRLGR